MWRERNPKNKTGSLLNTKHKEGSGQFKDQSTESSRKTVETKLVELSEGKYLCDLGKLF